MNPSLFRPRLLAVVVATSLLAGLVLASFWEGALGPEFVLWLLLCILGEMMWVRHPAGHATLSTAIACNFAAMLVLPPHGAIIAVGLSTVIVEAAWMRKHPLRVMFNGAQSMLSAAAGIAVWHVVVVGQLSSSALGLAELGGCAAAAVAYTLVNTSAVSVMIALEHGIAPQKAWRINFGNRYELLNNGSLFSLGGLLAVLIGKVGAGAVALVALPLVLVWVSYRRVLERQEDATDIRRAA